MTDFPVVLNAKEDVSIKLPENVCFADVYVELKPKFLGRDSEGKMEFWLLQGKIVKVVRTEEDLKP